MQQRPSRQRLSSNAYVAANGCSLHAHCQRSMAPGLVEVRSAILPCTHTELGARSSGGHYGLVGMQVHASRIRGKLTIASGRALASTCSLSSHTALSFKGRHPLTEPESWCRQIGPRRLPTRLLYRRGAYRCLRRQLVWAKRSGSA